MNAFEHAIPAPIGASGCGPAAVDGFRCVHLRGETLCVESDWHVPAPRRFRVECFGSRRAHRASATPARRPEARSNTLPTSALARVSASTPARHFSQRTQGFRPRSEALANRVIPARSIERAWMLRSPPFVRRGVGVSVASVRRTLTTSKQGDIDANFRQFAARLVASLGLALLALPALAFANADVEKNIANSKNWAMQAGDMSNQRYSKLKQINTRQRRQDAGRVDVLHRRAARPRRLAAGDRRYDVPALAVPQQGLRARPRHPEDHVEVRAQAGSGGDSADVLRHGQPRPRLRRRQGLPAAGRQHAGGARRQDRQGGVEREERRPEAGRGQHQRAARLQGQGHHRHQRRRVGRARLHRGLRLSRPASRSGRATAPARTTRC